MKVKLIWCSSKCIRFGLVRHFYPFFVSKFPIILGDRLLAQDQAQQSWSKPQDVTKNLYYPQHGIGAVVTYLEISVDQSTNLGQARVIGGGIGQRHISVVIEARSTLYFAYRAQIYGY